MPVRIRLALHGCTNRPFYHIVVARSQCRRDGKHLEQVGTFDPLPNMHNEKLVALNMERIKYWLGVGAEPTRLVFKILGLAGILPVHPRSYLETRRRKAALLEQAALLEKAHTDGSSKEADSDESDG